MRKFSSLCLALLVALLLTACGSEAEQGIGTLPTTVSPQGRWSSFTTGIFDVLPAGTDRYTVVFKDTSRPKLAMRTIDLNYSALGSITNSLTREITEYSLSGTFSSTQLNGTLRIVKKRSTTGVVFSTQLVQVRALKQRHDTF